MRTPGCRWHIAVGGGDPSESGQASLDTYEKTLQNMADFEKSLASHSQLDCVSALANTHANFVQDLSSFYIKAAREAVK